MDGEKIKVCKTAKQEEILYRIYTLKTKKYALFCQIRKVNIAENRVAQTLLPNQGILPFSWRDDMIKHSLDVDVAKPL